MLNDILKIGLFGICLFLLELGLGQFWEISGIRPDLLLIFVVIISIRKGRYYGLFVGFFAGIFQDIFSLEFLGVYAFIKCTIGFWLGYINEQEKVILKSGTWLMYIGLAAFSQYLWNSLIYSFGSETSIFSSIVSFVFPSTLYTLSLGLLWILLPLRTRLNR